MNNGLHIEYSPVNQAYFLMWFDHVLFIKTDKAEAQAEMDDLLRGTTAHPNYTPEVA